VRALADRPPVGRVVIGEDLTMVLASEATVVVPSGALSDAELIRAHRAGSKDAFAILVRRHYPALRVIARRQLLDDADVDDALQETFLRAFRGLDRFGTSGEWRFGAWLTRILTNVCADLRAASRTRLALGERVSTLRVLPAQDAAEQVPDREAADAVRSALASLPASQRRAFELRVVEDLPYPCVAATLGISEDNARARVHRARAALRRALAAGEAGLASFGALGVGVRRRLASARWRMVRFGSATSARQPAALASRTGTGLLRPPNSSAATRVCGPRTPHRPHLAPLAGHSGSSASTLTSAASWTGSTPVGAASQLVGQFAASPVGQLVMATTTVPGRGSVAAGLAAGLAAAGALAMPAPSPARPDVRPAAHAAAPAAVLTAPVSTPPSQTPADSPPDPASASDGATASSPTGSAPASPSATSVPGWVAIAAAVTGAESSARSPSAVPSSSATATSTSASAPTPTSTTAPPTVDRPPAGASATFSTTATAPPPVACTTVPGFLDLPTVPPPGLDDGAITDMLDTGALTMASGSTAPAFAADSTLRTVTGQPVGVVGVAGGTCLAPGGSLLAVAVSGPGATMVQLAGVLVGQLTTAASGSASGSTTYLFRGVVEQIGGPASSTLPWGLPSTFVAELQINEHANTADLTVAFLDPSTAAGPVEPPAATSADGARAGASPGAQPSTQVATPTTLPSGSPSATGPTSAGSAPNAATSSST
jgi:RNA polymerase sigma factor (sigma-70 family)